MGNAGDVFMSCDEGLFNAVHSLEHGVHAQEFLRDITKHIFTGEGNSFQTEFSKRTNFTPIVGLHPFTYPQPMTFSTTHVRTAVKKWPMDDVEPVASDSRLSHHQEVDCDSQRRAT